MKLYFIRHGESTANLLHEFSNNAHSHPITEQGVAQAHTLACTLQAAQIEMIYTSPVLRAVQTAHILSESLQIPLEIDNALQEWNVGIYEGTTDPVGWELHRQVQEDWFIHHKLDSKMPGGESFIGLKERFIPFIDKLLQVEIPDKNIALVGHGGHFLAMLPVILKNIDLAFILQFPIPYTGIVLAETRPDGLYCLSWCGESIV